MSKKSDFFSKYFFIIVYLIFVVGLIIVSNIYFLEASSTDNRGLDYIGEAIAEGIFMLVVTSLFFIIVPVIVSIVFIIRYVGLNINENTKSSIVCVLKTISSYFIYYYYYYCYCYYYYYYYCYCYCYCYCCYYYCFYLYLYY